ncbi:MAG: 30S ribosomal protein S3 [Candidatus Micrarchaeota archaeon]|nr:30S ribosomal protein S3 [Candidatus Micrarchaeota archaeon]
MAIERKFIDDSINRYLVSKFLEKELDRAGFSKVDIQRTPMVTRISVEAMNPGRVIGRKGKTIKDLTDAIHNSFKLDNPQISVVEVREPNLEPRLIAKRIVKFIEMGKNLRRMLHMSLKMVMDSGALGAEIVASGKISAKGGRARRLRVSAGYLPKAGEPARYVSKAHVTAYPKAGAIGVLVCIVQPGTVFPDKQTLKPVELPNIIAEAGLDETVPVVGEPVGGPGEAGEAGEARRKKSEKGAPKPRKKEEKPKEKAKEPEAKAEA